MRKGTGGKGVGRGKGGDAPEGQKTPVEGQFTPNREAKPEYDEVAARRMAAVIRSLTDGYSSKEVAIALIRKQLSGGTTYFTFHDPQPQSDAEYEERAWASVRKDLSTARIRRGPASKSVEDNRFLLEESLRDLFKHAWQAAKDEKSGPGKAMLLGRAIEARIKLARVQGIDTERPTVIKFPDHYVVTIDEEGNAQMRKEQTDEERAMSDGDVAKGGDTVELEN